jgi:ABC-type transporter Mla maintaining outer membrane lipid asymmetry ATPase subunit MlaF
MAALIQWMLATLSGVQVCSLIIGESGTGKTELLKMFVAQHRAQRDQNGIILT